MRQVYPGGSALDDAAVAALYNYPDLGAPPARWLRANMVASLDGAATVDGRSGGLSNAGGPTKSAATAIAMIKSVATITSRQARSGQNGLPLFLSNSSYSAR